MPTKLHYVQKYKQLAILTQTALLSTNSNYFLDKNTSQMEMCQQDVQLLIGNSSNYGESSLTFHIDSAVLGEVELKGEGRSYSPPTTDSLLSTLLTQRS